MEENIVNIDSLPVVVSRGIVVFPGAEMGIDIGRQKSLNACQLSEEAFDKTIIIVCQKHPEQFDPTIDEIYKVGTLCSFNKTKTNPDGTIKIDIKGLKLVQLDETIIQNGMVFAKFHELEVISGDESEEQALIASLTKSLNEVVSNKDIISNSLAKTLLSGNTSTELSNIFGSLLPFDFVTKQEILETLDLNTRLYRILEELEKMKYVAGIEKQIDKKVQQSIEKNQKEYILREKIKAIKEELGDTFDNEIDKIRNKLEKGNYPKNVKDKVLQELKRYESMVSQSPEAGVIRNYVDWMMSLPWNTLTTDNEDLNVVEETLNKDHYGLEKIKERILEYLAVKKLTSSLKAPILCFVGPPGTGKTSLALSIARAIGRKSVKVALGGISDEAEIRGHRRTYIGAMPGRIIQGMKKAQTSNPVFILDEIDKLGRDYKGDPANALLEVLDPEQNKIFQDNYIEENFDLSNVLFIATANYIENIPAPLLDRLEIIQLSSYTEMEKLNIAKNHLVKKQLKQNGLKPSKVSITDEALLYLIRNYTRESGVRNLEREIGTLARKTAVYMLKNNIEGRQTVGIKKLKELLGKEKFDYTKKEKKDQIGVVTGLAYTQYGGDILPVEVTYFAGSGNIKLTGNLGDVMKESASIAYSYVKANAKKYNIDEEKFAKIDLHIHFPEGAVPKDGPSAGVTMTTAIVSALCEAPCRSDIAMTGEITLRGNVLPIGGLKEKSISAHRSGIKTIYIPKDNEKDIEDIPQSVRDELKIILVEHVSEIIKDVLTFK
ncbi:MAG: endopeptidase La [Bacilli bacterium]|nr:endopeptidase La [Bacilli bacterium]